MTLSNSVDLFRLRFLPVALLALLASSLPQAASACRLALVLAVDVSKSVDSSEFELQFQGLADAFRDPKVRIALLSSRESVAIAAFEWSGEQHQSVITDWFFVHDATGPEYLASLFENHQSGRRGRSTAIGEAVSFARLLLNRVPHCARHVIDVSGDGYNNIGRKPSEVYRAYEFADITVNGLVIGGHSRPELRQYFETEVIRGPNAFVVPTRGFEDYGDAIRRKLLREIKPPELVAMTDDR